MILFISTALIALSAAGAILTVGLVGKARQPISAGAAVATLILSALQIAGVLFLARS